VNFVACSIELFRRDGLNSGRRLLQLLTTIFFFAFVFHSRRSFALVFVACSSRHFLISRVTSLYLAPANLFDGAPLVFHLLP
jgi:hypothetical protein